MPAHDGLLKSAAQRLCAPLFVCVASTALAQVKPVMAWIQLNLPPGTILVVGKPATLQKMAQNSQGEVLPAALFDRADMAGRTTPWSPSQRCQASLAARIHCGHAH